MHPIICKVLYIPGGCLGFLPSTGGGDVWKLGTHKTPAIAFPVYLFVPLSRILASSDSLDFESERTINWAREFAGHGKNIVVKNLV